jgi:general secretion pathway protein K
MMRQRAHGAALITALLIAAIAAAVAAAMLALQTREIARLERSTDRSQLTAYLTGGFDWAKSVLALDQRVNAVDHLGENWATPLAALPIDNAIVAGELTDAQGRFNVNLLVQDGRADAVWVARYRALLNELKLSEDLAVALVDWLDADSEGRFEDSTYLFLDPPYRAANQPITTVSELSLVKGYTPEVIRTLLPNISALPSSAKRTINANTASSTVLRAILAAHAVKSEKLQSFVESRVKSPLTQATDLANAIGATSLGDAASALGVGSDFFYANFEARQGEARIAGQALLNRSRGTGATVNAWPSIIALEYQ